MLLEGVIEERGWLVSRWHLTYRAGWESLCKGVYSVYDYYKNIEILVDNNPVKIDSKEDIKALAESSTITFRGISDIVRIPIMITLYNQLDAVDVNVAMAVEEFNVPDYERFNKSLCQYLTSIEIAMHR